MRSATVALALLVPQAALAGWPADVDWEPLTLDDDPMADVAFDANDDIVMTGQNLGYLQIIVDRGGVGPSSVLFAW